MCVRGGFMFGMSVVIQNLSVGIAALLSIRGIILPGA